MSRDLYDVAGLEGFLTPCLVYYKDIIEENTRKLIERVGGCERLWPHVKSHKMREMVQMQMSLGISRFKCATLGEASVVAECHPKAILVAYPIIGKAVDVYLDMVSRYPDIAFYTIVDDAHMAERLADAFASAGLAADVLIDVNVGLDRTGVPLSEVPVLIGRIIGIHGLHVAGLHVYDGNLHMPSAFEREAAVRELDSKINQVIDELASEGIELPIIVAGGSGTSYFHSIYSHFFLSPGTSFVNDDGYFQSYQELDYIPAGIIMTHVISHPGAGLFTLDLGYKAIGAEMAGPAGRLLGVDADPVFQNEEHWVWKMHEGHASERPEIGEILLVVPTHICPTTNLYDEAVIVSGGKVQGVWRTVAHKRFP